MAGRQGGWTPNDTDEYAVNFIKQLGEKGAPLNVLNNPPVPPNSYWRWPYWTFRTSVVRNFDVVFGLKNVGDQHFEPAWGFRQPGRSFYVKTRVGL
jgi:hypothetical protein